MRKLAGFRRSRHLTHPALESRSVAIFLTIAILLYLVLGPVLMLIFSSFRDVVSQLPFEAGVPWSIQNYVHVLTNPRTFDLLMTTFVFVTGSLSVSFGLSLTFAWLVERTDFPFRNVLYVGIVAALGIPTIIASLAFALLLNPANGLLNIGIRTLLGMDATANGPFNAYTLGGMIFVEGIAIVPITFLLVAAAFRTMDASVEDAGATSGAPFRSVVRRISLPLLRPALLGALVYQFVTVLTSFDIPFVLGLRGGGTVLSTQVYIETQPAAGLPDYGLASTYAMLLMALALGPLLLYNATTGRSERYATVSGNTYRPQRMPLGVWKVPAAILSIGYLMIAFILPVLVMVWTSLQAFYAIPSPESIGRISLDGYATTFADPRFSKAVGNTFLLGAVAAFGAMTIGLMVSWLLVRTRSRLRVVLDVLAFTPHAIPGVIIGLSVMLIYLLLPIPLYGSIWVIAIALGTAYIAISTRLMTSGIVQIQTQLEEAAAASGASWWPTIRRVVLPLVFPAFANGFLLLFTMGIKNLTLPILLSTPDSVVISSILWNVWSQGETTEAASIGVLMVIVTTSLAVITRRLATATAAS